MYSFRFVLVSLICEITLRTDQCKQFNLCFINYCQVNFNTIFLSWQRNTYFHLKHRIRFSYLKMFEHWCRMDWDDLYNFEAIKMMHMRNCKRQNFKFSVIISGTFLLTKHFRWIFKSLFESIICRIKKKVITLPECLCCINLLIWYEL